MSFAILKCIRKMSHASFIGVFFKANKLASGFLQELILQIVIRCRKIVRMHEIKTGNKTEQW